MASAEDIVRNSKSGAQIDIVTSVKSTDYAFMYSPELGKVVKILRTNLPESSGNLSTSKFELTATSEGQTDFYIASKPDNVDIIANNGFLSEDSDTVTYDYSYDPLTGVLIIHAGLPINSLINGRGYSDDLSTKQSIVATSEDQTVFNYSGAPNSIEVITNDGYLSENHGYVKTNFSTGNYITLTKGVEIDSLVIIRKF